MMKLLFLALVVTTLTITIVESSPGQQRCKRMTAALRFKGGVFIFFGDQYVELDETYKQNSSLLEVYPDWGSAWPDAAVQPYWGDTPFFFSDDRVYWSDDRHSPVDAYDFGGRFFRHGLDAAGYLNNTMIFIRGCHYKSDAYSWHRGPVFPISKDLPCRPDAALTEGENLIIFKGDKMWVVEPDGVQEGMPKPTNQKITLDGTELCEWDGDMD